jgi:hypothetical protein
MDLTQKDQEMVKEIIRTGVRAAVLLRGVMLQKVNRETLAWGFEELDASSLIQRYFPDLIDRPNLVELLNILHLVSSLESQWEFQVSEYGLDSLKDDLHEINFSLQQIGQKFDFEELQKPI